MAQRPMVAQAIAWCDHQPVKDSQKTLPQKNFPAGIVDN